MRRRPAQSGFTLIELAIATAVALLLAAVAVPACTGHLERARRADAVASLTRVHMAQERYRALHGMYASGLQSLTGASAARSEGGHYDIGLREVGTEGFSAVARARADGPQARDAECAEILLVVTEGMPNHAPSRRCWNL